MSNQITYVISPFDFWSLIHFGFYAFLSSTIASIFKEPKWYVHLIYWFVLTFGWETAEHFLSRSYPASWGYRIESFQNSWIGDPISNLAGVIFGVFVVYFYRHIYKKSSNGK